MGNGDSCGDSTGRHRQGKINEIGRTWCMEEQSRSDLVPGLAHRSLFCPLVTCKSCKARTNKYLKGRQTWAEGTGQREEPKDAQSKGGCS